MVKRNQHLQLIGQKTQTLTFLRLCCSLTSPDHFSLEDSLSLSYTQTHQMTKTRFKQNGTDHSSTEIMGEAKSLAL